MTLVDLVRAQAKLHYFTTFSRALLPDDDVPHDQQELKKAIKTALTSKQYGYEILLVKLVASNLGRKLSDNGCTRCRFRRIRGGGSTQSWHRL
jgi:hypothetical protein